MPMHRYWDANVFLEYFNKDSEEWKKDLCESVLRHAEMGRLYIVTSYITYVEVIRMKGEPRIPREQERKIRKFFEQEYIIPRILDRQIAELARQLIWDHNLDPKDAIHAAPALKLKIRYLDTFDNDLIKVNGRIGNPPITIALPPEMPSQGVFEFDEGENSETETDTGSSEEESVQ